MERKRQQRGLARMEALVGAAEQVFAEVGFERATTNQIAARAGVSPGTFYQFFADKGAIAQALAQRYAARFEAVHQDVLAAGIEQLPLREFIDLVVDPFLAFHQQAKAFDALLLGGAMPGELSERIIELKTSFETRLVKLFLARRPKAKPAEMQTAVAVSLSIFRGMLPLLTQESPTPRRRAEKELKVVLERYLAPLLDDSGGV